MRFMPVLGSVEVALRQLTVGHLPVVAGDFGEYCIQGFKVHDAPGPFLSYPRRAGLRMLHASKTFHHAYSLYPDVTSPSSAAPYRWKQRSAGRKSRVGR